MNTGHESLERALDQALARACAAPAVPRGFRARLQAAVARVGEVDAGQARALLEAEHRRQLADLQSGYLRMQRRTLGTLLGAAFATGVVVTLAMPWIRQNFGPDGVFLLPAAGAAIGIAIGGYSWLQRSGAARLLR